MHWLFIAILGPLFWSLTNHLDKFLLSKHMQGVGKGALVLYSTFFGVIMLPIAFIIDNSVFSIGHKNILILVVCGILSSFAIYLYLYALEDEEASIVVPFFQTIPVFGYFMGLFFLGEHLTTSQIIGGLIIMLGAIILSFEITDDNGVSFKRKITLLMFASSISFALYEVLFKLAAVEEGFWKATFWQYVGLFIFGLCLFTCVKKYRSDFLFLIRKHNWKLFSINITNEGLTILGNSFYNFALLLAPAALVMITTGYQPLFVFLEGILLTLLFPHIIKEDISARSLMHKAGSIVLIIVGTYFLF
jgi:drug/metabolite transporter (DMT)-like permease